MHFPISFSINIRHSTIIIPSRAPGERQTPAAGLYSGAMMMPPPYRPAASTATGFGADYFSTGRFSPLVGEYLKKMKYCRDFVEFCTEVVPPGHSAPSPIVPASKLYTTPTMLSSGDTPKKRNFVGILLNFGASVQQLAVECWMHRQPLTCPA